MTLNEIIQKIHELSPHEREILRRELGATLEKPEAQSATPETVASLHREQRSSHDERGLPIEDVLGDPKPKEGA